MGKPGRTRLFGMLLVTALGVGGATARGQDGPAPRQVSSEDLARAKRVFDAGGRSYDQGDYEAALQAFEQAYAIAPRPNILFSMAQAHRRQYAVKNERAHKEKALDLYRQFLATNTPGKRRAEATKAIEELGPVAPANPAEPPSSPLPIVVVKKTMLAIDSPTPGAAISIDGGRAAPPQVNAEVAAGRHLVHVTAPGFIAKDVSVQAILSEITPETVELDEKPGRLVVAAPSGASLYVDGGLVGEVRPLALRPGRHFVSVVLGGHVSAGIPVEMRRGEQTTARFDLGIGPQRIAAIALLAGGALAVGAGAVTLGLSAARASQASDIDATRQAGSIPEASLADYDALRAEASSLRNIGFGVGGAGLGVVIAGLTMFFADRPSPIAAPPLDSPTVPAPVRDEGPEIQWSPVAGTEGAGVCVRGTF